MTTRGKPNKRYSNAWAISDRSGMRFKMKEMIREPGTGYLIHKSESDGMWNYVDHPQANLQKWATFSGDPFPVPDARPDRYWPTDNEISTDNTAAGDIDDFLAYTISDGKEDPQQ